MDRVASTGLLHPVLRRKVEAVISDLSRHGVRACIYETYRSQARQEECYRDGASELRTVGLHHFGLACDIVMLDHRGQPTWDEAYHPHYLLLAKLADAHRLVPGWDWGHPERPHKFRDQPHVQFCSQRRECAVLRGEWYPDDDYDALGDS